MLASCRAADLALRTRENDQAGDDSRDVSRGTSRWSEFNYAITVQIQGKKQEREILMVS